MNYKIEIININKLYYLLMFIATAVTFWSAIDYFIGIVKNQKFPKNNIK